ncbi:hypothetical protein [Streptomyces sp. AF1A]|jgi:hypothetical protein|uniref:hypothetical protein n=1 Tax=Streptomyces sp. AF1A TaxID=3394350 RepID=UPI0039BD7167
MNGLATSVNLHLPDVAQLLPRQQMAMDCAICARPLGTSGRLLGEVRHRGLLFQIWVCLPGCQTRRSELDD